MELAVVSSNLSGTIFLKYIRHIFGWLVCFPNSVSRPLFAVVVVVFFTLTDRTSTIPSNIRGCQSGTWSQRGTKVNGSHHGHKEVPRSTGIQITTKSYTTLQAMAPTNNKTVHQTSFTPYREQPRSTRIVVAYPRPAFSAKKRSTTFQLVSINNSKFLKATHRTKIRKIEIPRSMGVEVLSWRSRRVSQHPAGQSSVHLEKAPRILPARRSMWPS